MTDLTDRADLLDRTDTFPATTHAATAGATTTDEWYKVFPWRKRAFARWFGAWAVLSAIYVAAGLFYTRVLTGVVAAETELSRDVVAERTSTRTDWAEWASFVSDTIPKIVIVTLLVGVFAAVWKRWHDGVMLVTTLLLEVSVFGFAARVVDRDRPPIEQLDGAPTQSFPSGHAAAATAMWVTLFAIVAWHTRKTWIRALFGALMVLVPAMVIASRFYLGMHYVSDLIAGVILGIASSLLMRRILAAELDAVDDAQPLRLRRLDVSGP